jgi:serine/threonine protein kinase
MPKSQKIKIIKNPSSIDHIKDNSLDIKNIRNKKRVDNFPIELTEYTNIQFIGEGGFCYVYKANRRKYNRIVAVKIPMKKDRNIGKSFLSELRIWVGLKHPNIVKVYDHNIFPVPFIEMEFCDRCLDDLKKPLKKNEAIDVIIQIARGLQFAHNNGIVHLDIKPDNIFFKGNIPKISDWGLSKLAKSNWEKKIGITPPFAAPEQYSKDFGLEDEQTDIWQLGALFYYILSNKYPFPGKNFNENKINITDRNIKPVFDTLFDEEVISILSKCLSKEKKNRYKSMDNVIKDLEKIT